MSINSFMDKFVINIYFMASTFILGILCFLMYLTAWPFFRGATNCNVKNPSKDCKEKTLFSNGKIMSIALLVVSVYFVYVRFTSILKGMI